MLGAQGQPVPSIVKPGPLEEPASGTARPRATRLYGAAVALLIAVFLGLGWQTRPPLSIIGGDEPTYLSMSESLEHGSYRESFRANRPLHQLYPPGYPAWLVGVRHGLGESLDVIRAVNLLLAAAALLLMVGVVKGLAGSGYALAWLMLLVFHGDLLTHSGSAHSESLYLLLSCAALVLTWRTKPELAEGKGGKWVAVALLAVAAFLVRPVGLAVLVGVAIWLIQTRRRVALLGFVTAGVLLVGGWLTYVKRPTNIEAGTSHAADFSAGFQEEPGRIMALLEKVWTNVKVYATSELPFSLQLPTLPGTVVDNLFWLLLTLVVLAFGMASLWRKWPPAMTYLAAYGGILLMWPWPAGRLLVPVVPVLLLTALLGVQQALLRVPARWRAACVGALAILVGLGYAPRLAARLERSPACDRSSPYTSPGCYDPGTRSMIAAAMFLRDHAAPGEVVLTGKPSSIHYLSGLQAEPAQLLDGVEEGGAAAELRKRGIDYVIISTVLPQERGPLAHALRASCTELRVEGQFDSRALLLSPLPAPSDSMHACQALRAFLQQDMQDGRWPLW